MVNKSISGMLKVWHFKWNRNNGVLVNKIITISFGSLFVEDIDISGNSWVKVKINTVGDLELYDLENRRITTIGWHNITRISIIFKDGNKKTIYEL